MQMIMNGTHLGKASVIFMPMIAMKSSDELYIFSTIIFISQQPNKFKTAPTVIFYQRLWLKSLAIQSHLIVTQDVSVLRLCVVLTCIYAETAVTRMVSGKAISRTSNNKRCS